MNGGAEFREEKNAVPEGFWGVVLGRCTFGEDRRRPKYKVLSPGTEASPREFLRTEAGSAVPGEDVEQQAASRTARRQLEIII